MSLEEDLLWYLVSAVQQEDGTPAKTRLIKLVYLVDLHHTKRYGKPATAVRWIFYHYGPYATELDRALSHQVGINIRQLDVENHFGDLVFTYRSVGVPPDDLLPRPVQSIADYVAHQWALSDLNELLTYVYFETPPMQGVSRGDALDLNRVIAADWPKRYSALSTPKIDPDLRKGLDPWRRRINEEFPVTPLVPAPNHDGDYQRETETENVTQPSSAALGRGRLSIDPDLDFDEEEEG